MYKQLITLFTTNELIRWQAVEQLYGAELKKLYVFAEQEHGAVRWKELHSRVTEHNLRVIAMYYQCITSSRLCELLDLQPDAAEEFLSKLVTDKTIYAKIDRIAGTVQFARTRKADDVVQEWTSQVHQLLDLVSNTTHMIAKEEILAGIKKTQVGK